MTIGVPIVMSTKSPPNSQSRRNDVIQWLPACDRRSDRRRRVSLGRSSIAERDKDSAQPYWLDVSKTVLHQQVLSSTRRQNDHSNYNKNLMNFKYVTLIL